MFKFIKKALIPKSKPKPIVKIVRHGATSFNNTDKSEDRIRGHIDIPLNEEGIKDAEKAAKTLQKDPIQLFYCSDLSRATRTAEEIQKYHPKAQIIYMTQLRPWQLGVYQGQITANVLSDLQHLIENPDLKPKDGESFNEFKHKFLGSLDHIIQQAIKDNSEIVVVSHYRNLKTADAWANKGFPENLDIDEKSMLKDEFTTGEIYILDIDKYIKCRVK